MSNANDRQGFSAHGGMRDVPRGAVPLKNADAEVKEPTRKSYVGVLVLVLFVGFGVLFAQNSEQINDLINKPIRVVKMANPLQRANENSIRAALAAHLDGGFFALNVQAIKEHLESNPWVEKAVITRIWPDTLSVAITEEVAIARWGENRLLNQYGESFAPEFKEDDFTLPSLKGPEGMERKVMEQYQVFSQMLSNTGLRIREIDLSERGSWILRMDNDLLVSIGRNDVMARVQRFVKFYERHLHAEIANVAAIDLRYNNGISIRNKTDMPVGVASK